MVFGAAANPALPSAPTLVPPPVGSDGSGVGAVVWVVRGMAGRRLVAVTPSRRPSAGLALRAIASEAGGSAGVILSMRVGGGSGVTTFVATAAGAGGPAGVVPSTSASWPGGTARVTPSVRVGGGSGVTALAQCGVSTIPGVPAAGKTCNHNPSLGSMLLPVGAVTYASMKGTGRNNL